MNTHQYPYTTRQFQVSCVDTKADGIHLVKPFDRIRFNWFECWKSKYQIFYNSLETWYSVRDTRHDKRCKWTIKMSQTTQSQRFHLVEFKLLKPEELLIAILYSYLAPWSQWTIDFSCFKLFYSIHTFLEHSFKQHLSPRSRVLWPTMQVSTRVLWEWEQRTWLQQASTNPAFSRSLQTTTGSQCTGRSSSMLMLVTPCTFQENLWVEVCWDRADTTSSWTMMVTGRWWRMGSVSHITALIPGAHICWRHQDSGSIPPTQVSPCR